MVKHLWFQSVFISADTTFHLYSLSMQFPMPVRMSSIGSGNLLDQFQDREAFEKIKSGKKEKPKARCELFNKGCHALPQTHAWASKLTSHLKLLCTLQSRSVLGMKYLSSSLVINRCKLICCYWLVSEPHSLHCFGILFWLQQRNNLDLA